MTKTALLLLLICFSFLPVVKGQDYLSNNDLMGIKEQSEARRYAWNKAFDDGVAKKDFSALPSARQATQSYIDAQITSLRRLYATGDGRELITAVTNYLQIQRQYIKDVMLPAEALTPAQETEVGEIIRKMNDFGGKEKVFLLEINSALANSPEDPQANLQIAEPEESEEAAPPAQEDTKTKVKTKNGKTKVKKEAPEEEEDN
jgi:hypothetical protein